MSHLPLYMDPAEDPSKPTHAATPLLSVEPVNHGNNKAKSINSVATLYIVLVEPTYLQLIRNSTFSNAYMTKFVDWPNI